MSIQRITPDHARALLDRGATVVDIREKDEYARERIPRALNVPLASIGDAPLATQHTSAVIFQCKSGARTAANAAKLAAAAGWWRATRPAPTAPRTGGPTRERSMSSTGRASRPASTSRRPRRA